MGFGQKLKEQLLSPSYPWKLALGQSCLCTLLAVMNGWHSCQPQVLGGTDHSMPAPHLNDDCILWRPKLRLQQQSKGLALGPHLHQISSAA